MRPQKQAFNHNPTEGVIGDCHRTVIACLLDLDRDCVPHFAFPDFTDVAKFNAREAAFLKSHGLASVTVYFAGTLNDVLGAQKNNPGVYYILGGQSKSGVNHSVIGLDDAIVWDEIATHDAWINLKVELDVGIEDDDFDMFFIDWRGTQLPAEVSAMERSIRLLRTMPDYNSVCERIRSEYGFDLDHELASELE